MIEFAVAVLNVGDGGLSGPVAALIYDIGEKSDHPFMLLVRKRNLYV